MGLRGKRAVVTGGGRGIGAAVVEQLAISGAKVVASARTEFEISNLAERLSERGLEVFSFRCDVTSESSVADLAAGSRELLGGVDILVNNAGIAPSAPVHRTTLEVWEETFAVNCRGVFLATRAFLPEMIERGWGRIIQVASVASLSGAPYISAYAATKHAVLGFTKSVALEVAKKGVTVNAVCPGYVDTPMTDASVAKIQGMTSLNEEQARKVLSEMSPQGRLLEANEVSAAVLYLCGDAARGITGQSLVLDGGSMAGMGGKG